MLERSNGDVRQAIVLYERIANEFASDRTLAARALIRLGLAHEALGDLEAREAYQRVLRDFGDQTDMVSQARARLAALAGDPAEAVVITSYSIHYTKLYESHATEACSTCRRTDCA